MIIKKPLFSLFFFLSLLCSSGEILFNREEKLSCRDIPQPINVLNERREQNNERRETNLYQGKTINGQANDAFGESRFEFKQPLISFCSEKDEIDGGFINLVDSEYFYSRYPVLTTLSSHIDIDLSSYSRFEITDWLYKIGKITAGERIDIYSSLFSQKLFENERSLTYKYENYKTEALTNGQKIYRFAEHDERSSPQVYSTAHFDINYDGDVFSTNNIPSQIGQRFENIRSFFVTNGYPVPNNEHGHLRYQIHIYHEPSTLGAALTVHDGVPYPNSTSYINMYFVSLTELDGKFNEVAAHEWYHALRAQYYSGIEWFDDAFANWAGIVYDGDSEYANGSINAFLNSDTSLDDTSEGLNYGACLFPMVLFKDYGGHPFIRGVLSNYRNVIQDFPYSNGTNRLKEAINRTLNNNGNGDCFDDVLRLMHSYNYLPNSWYNDVCSTSTTCYWQNNDKTICNLLPLDGSSENTVEGTKTYTNINISRVGRKYFRLAPSNGRTYNVEFEISFSGVGGYAEHHSSEPSGAIQIGFLNNVNNSTSWHFYSLGNQLNDAGIVLTNASTTDSCTCSVTIRYKALKENYTFGLSDRLFQRRFFLNAGDHAEYTITFANPGKKIIQTFGPLDTVIELLSPSGSLLNNSYGDDDKGFGSNSFSVYDCSANETIKVKVSFYNANLSGYTKLIITNSEDVANSPNGIQAFNDITEIVNDNFYFGTWCTRYKSDLLLYRPTTSGTVKIELSSLFDNYLYVIDPTSNALNICGIDYDDDSGSGSNASITRYLSSSHPYLVIYVQYNPSSNFSNLNEGDDLTVHFERIS